MNTKDFFKTAGEHNPYKDGTLANKAWRLVKQHGGGKSLQERIQKAFNLSQEPVTLQEGVQTDMYHEGTKAFYTVTVVKHSTEYQDLLGSKGKAQV